MFTGHAYRTCHPVWQYRSGRAHGGPFRRRKRGMQNLQRRGRPLSSQPGQAADRQLARRKNGQLDAFSACPACSEDSSLDWADEPANVKPMQSLFPGMDTLQRLARAGTGEVRQEPMTSSTCRAAQAKVNGTSIERGESNRRERRMNAALRGDVTQRG